MPKMTGMELSKKLLDIRSNIPIVIASGYNENVNKVYSNKNGIREFLKKPYTFGQLARLIRKVLDNKSEKPMPSTSLT